MTEEAGGEVPACAGTTEEGGVREDGEPAEDGGVAEEGEGLRGSCLRRNDEGCEDGRT